MPTPSNNTQIDPTGRPVSDVDITTPLTPEAVTDALQRARLRAIPTGITYGTVTALAEGATIEITMLRHDVETDGRHAVVAFTDDFRVDAARRDFTINALSLTAPAWQKPRPDVRRVLNSDACYR